MGNFATDAVDTIVNNDSDFYDSVQCKIENIKDIGVTSKSEAVEILAEWIEQEIEPLITIDLLPISDLAKSLLYELMDTGEVDYEEIAEGLLEDWIEPEEDEDESEDEEYDNPTNLPPEREGPID
jgi:hypothetical protein